MREKPAVCRQFGDYAAQHEAVRVGLGDDQVLELCVAAQPDIGDAVRKGFGISERDEVLDDAGAGTRFHVDQNAWMAGTMLAARHELQV